MIEVEILTRVKTILGVQDKDELLTGLIQNQMEALMLLIGENVVPGALAYIVVETVIARYNRLGSEGLKSENIDVIGQTFIENLLGPYQTQIDGYIKTKNKTTSKLRLL
jgi:hypothetical protein